MWATAALSLRNARIKASNWSLFSWAASRSPIERYCRRYGALLESEELALTRSAMESFTVVAAGALAKITRTFNELQTAAKRRCNVADENRVEQGIRLEGMDEFGMRNRLASGQASGANNNPDSPSTTGGESGVMTPGTDENSESQGMNAMHEV